METNENVESNETHSGWLAFRVLDLAGTTLGNVLLGFDEEDGDRGELAVRRWLDEHKGQLGAQSGLIDGGVLDDGLRPPPEYVGRFLSDEEMQPVLRVFESQRRSPVRGRSELMSNENGSELMSNENGSGGDTRDPDETELAELDTLRQEYLALMHAMQTGVAMELQQDPAGGSPKHLRVGVNSAKAEQGGLVRLLISKGVISELDYYRAMVEAARAEVAAYERDLLHRHGIVVKLG